MVAGRGATANRLVPAAKRDESDYSSASGRSKSEEKSPRTNANVSRLLIIFTAAVLPLISATVVILTVWGIEDAIETSNNERCVTVESVAWSSSTLVDLVLQGKPIVVENTPFTTWPCMDWTWQYLQDSVHADLPVKLSRTAEFKYSTSSKVRKICMETICSRSLGDFIASQTFSSGIVQRNLYHSLLQSTWYQDLYHLLF
eukprot:scpid86248/ scgid1238/ 